MPVDVSPAKAKAASVAAVVKTLSELESAPRKSGSSSDHSKTFDELCDWRKDDDGTFYWSKGPRDFDTYLERVFRSSTLARGPTRYVDRVSLSILPGSRRWTE